MTFCGLLRNLVLSAVLAVGALVATASAQEEQLDPENTPYLDLKDGRVVIKLRPDLAPNHVERIKTLTRKGFYDGLKFHRVLDKFMVQTGDPNGDGSGGSDLPDLKAEFSSPGKARHVTGVVSAARTSYSEDSANSQFYIMLGPAPWLDGQYSIWGQVVSGMKFVHNIKKGDPALDGEVTDPDKIVRMRVAADVKE